MTLPREHSSSTLSGFSHHCPGLAEEADLSWWHPLGQDLGPYPAIITEGTKCPWPSRPSGFLFKLEHIICIGSVRIHVVPKTNQVDFQLKAAPHMTCSLLYLNPDLWPPLRGDDWSELDQFLKLAWRQGSWEVITLKAVPTPSSRWGVCGLWPNEPAAAIMSGRWGQERGSLLLRGLGPASGQLWQGPRRSAWRGFQPGPGRHPRSPAVTKVKGPERPQGDGCDPPLRWKDRWKLTGGRAGPLTAWLSLLPTVQC